MLPANARQAHMEMGDTPMVDKGAFVMLGSDDYFLRQLAAKNEFERIKDYVAWTMHAAQAIAAAEASVGLAIFVVLFRHTETIDVNKINLLKW